MCNGYVALSRVRLLVVPFIGAAVGADAASRPLVRSSSSSSGGAAVTPTHRRRSWGIAAIGDAILTLLLARPLSR